jgi:hypothetical protein
MANGQSVAPPSAADIVASLGSAADAARQAYLAALAANPAADLSELYKKEMAAAAIWSAAENKALNGDPKVKAAQAALDAAAQNTRSKLGTLKDVAQWINLVDGLVQLAMAVSKFFI